MSNYLGVCQRPKQSSGDEKTWQAQLRLKNRRKWQNYYKSEREAAIAVDIKLIEQGKPPVNILKPKV